MLLTNLNKRALLFITIGYSTLSLLVLYLFNGTGIEADSINHYLYAKYAPIHPELFLNHWAKPIFTLLASPFAQFGFIGVKIFNVITGLFTTLLSYKIAVKFGLKHSILATIIIFIFPINFLVSFSALTEPLFSLILCLIILIILKQRLILAAIIISFLPFVRSEGLLFIGLFIAYFAFKKQLKPILFLGVGHLVFSIAGYFYYEDILWVFTKIPYASLSSHYGDGELFHFAEQLIYITGVPLLIFFLIGIVRTFTPERLQLKKLLFEFNFLIVGSFLVFFVAHTLFWYLGIFNSMGLKRVFAAVTPLMALICLYGFNSLEFIPVQWLKNTLKTLSLVYILVFPFTSNPAAVDWSKDLNLSNAQVTANDVAKYLEKNKLKNHRFVYTDPYLGEALQIDPFDSDQHLLLSLEAMNELQAGDIIIWDNWHAIIDYGVELSILEQDLKLVKQKEFDDKGVKYVVFLNIQ